MTTTTHPPLHTMYVTFGTAHRHEIRGRVYDADCVATIRCNNYMNGRSRVHSLLGTKWCFCYMEDDWLEHIGGHCEVMKIFKRGYISLDELEEKPHAEILEAGVSVDGEPSTASQT